jgi:WD40 repeat protein
MSFDPYHKWFGISPNEQPPNYYRLLGIPLFESDPDIIEAAAASRALYLKTLNLGEHAAIATEMLNEVALARLTLITPSKRDEYNRSIVNRERTADASESSTAPEISAHPDSSSPAVHATPTAPPVDQFGSPNTGFSLTNKPSMPVADVNIGSRRAAQRFKQKSNLPMVLGVVVGGALAIPLALLIIGQFSVSENSRPHQSTALRQVPNANSNRSPLDNQPKPSQQPSSLTASSGQTTPADSDSANSMESDDTASSIDFFPPENTTTDSSPSLLGLPLGDAPNEDPLGESSFTTSGIPGKYKYQYSLDFTEQGAPTAFTFGKSRMVAIGFSNGKVAITRIGVDNQSPVHILTPPGTTTARINALDFDSTGRLLIVSRVNTLTVYEVTEEEGSWSTRLLNSFTDKRIIINCVKWITFDDHPDKLWGIAGTNDGFLLLWDYSTNQQARTPKVHATGITTLALDLFGGFVYAGDRKGRLVQWGYDAKEETLKAFDAGSKGADHNGVIKALNWSDDGQRAASGASRQIKIWSNDTKGSGLVLEFTLNDLNGSIVDCDLSSKGDFVVACTNDPEPKILLWDLRKGNPTVMPLIFNDGTPDKYMKIQFSDDTSAIAAATFDGMVQVWLQESQSVANEDEPPSPQNRIPPPRKPKEPLVIDKSTLSSALKSGRNALKRRQFTLASDCAEAALLLANTDEQKAIATRLHDITEYAAKFQELLDESLDVRVKAGSTIRAGQSVAVVREISSEVIKLRVNGTNREFAREQLHVGVAFAFAEKYFEDAQMTPIIKAAFLLIQENPTARQLEVAQELLNTGKEAGAPVEGLELYLKDNYDFEDAGDLDDF